MKLDIIRAWKDESYRRSLSEEQQAQMPASPIGELELSDADLEAVHGGILNSVLGECQSNEGNCNSNFGNCTSSYSNLSCNTRFQQD